jgi:hypothetical protein
MGPYIYTFEVGQGDCHLILLDREAIVIDAGPAGTPVLPFLLRFGYIVKCLILTHNDADHSSGALRLVAELGKLGRIDSFGSLQDRAPNASANRTIALAMELYEKRFIRDLWRLEIEREAKIVARLGGTYTLSLLHPTYYDNLAAVGQHERRPAGPNRASAVLRLCDGAGKGLGLWSGDLPAEAWEMLSRRANCQAQWFVTPHHGSGSGWSSASMSAVLNAVNPGWMVVSVGTSNRYGHPSSDWIRAATVRKTRPVCTQLTEQCHRPLHSLDGAVLPRDPMIHSSAPGGVACAGTIIYNTENGEIFRSDLHQSRVSQLRTPMCSLVRAVNSQAAAPPQGPQRLP